MPVLTPYMISWASMRSSMKARQATIRSRAPGSNSTFSPRRATASMSSIFRSLPVRMIAMVSHLREAIIPRRRRESRRISRDPRNGAGTGVRASEPEAGTEAESGGRPARPTSGLTLNPLLNLPSDWMTSVEGEPDRCTSVSPTPPAPGLSVRGSSSGGRRPRRPNPAGDAAGRRGRGCP